MFDLPFVASRLYGTPLLVARPKLEVILQALGPRLTGEPLAAADSNPAERGQLRITEAGIAVLPIMGTLVRRSSYLSAASGLTSYHDIEADAQEAFTSPDVHGVLLEIDSCGGEASGLFDLVDALRDMAKSTGKPLWAVADEAALSAAYAIACAADKIFLPRTAEVGSVGVVAVHVDESGADAQAGLAYTYIHAGARKIDGNPHEPLSPDVKSRLQADVDVLYTEFVSLVAKRRKCSPEIIRATEAAVFRGQEAVNIGLADAVGTFQQAHDRLAASLQKQTMRSPFFITATSEASMSTDTAPSPEPAPANIPGAETLDAETLMAKAEANLCARFSALSDIAAQAGRLGIEVDPVKALREGVLPDALRQQVLQQAAERDNAASTIAAHSIEQVGQTGAGREGTLPAGETSCLNPSWPRHLVIWSSGNFPAIIVVKPFS